MSRPLRLLLALLTSGSTYRRFVHLLLGGVVLLPYLGLATLLVVSARDGGLDPVALVLLSVLAAGAGVGVTLVPGVRALEISAARALLGAVLTDPVAPESWAARRRASLWLLLNVAAGSVVALLTLIVVPTTLGFVLAPWRAFAGFPTGARAAWALPVGVALPVLLLWTVAAVGAGLAHVAPRLLGPPATERLAAELDRVRRAERTLAERNRLARELHDSIGHALTVTTLQAGAAARVLDTDPAFVGRALAAIADAGRTALEELDHVLGLLREDGIDRRPQPDLSDLDTLLAGARTAGVRVDADLAGVPDRLPPVVSREAYRIVQESLTNALRHAGPVPVTVRVGVDAHSVTVEVTNAASSQRARSGGGRGLAGLRERVAVLHGELVAGPQEGGWRVAANLPLTRVPPSP